ncbi:hypothetical protein RB596_004810 [Gaeumannomyces avenae]
MTPCFSLDLESFCRFVLVLAGAVSCALLPYVYLGRSRISAVLCRVRLVESYGHIPRTSRFVKKYVYPSLSLCHHCFPSIYYSLIVISTEVVPLLLADASSTMTETAVQITHASAAAALMNAVGPIPKRPITPENVAIRRKSIEVDQTTQEASGLVDGAGGEAEFGEDFIQDWFRYEPPDVFSSLLDGVRDEVRSVVQTSAENVRRRASLERQRDEETRKQTGQQFAASSTSRPDSTPDRKRRAPDSQTVALEHKASTGYADAGATAETLPSEPPARQERLFGRGIMGVLQEMHGKHGISFMLPSLTSKGKAPVTTVECVACLDDFVPKKTVKTACHSYCRPCFERLIETALATEAQWPPRCCLNEVPLNAIVNGLPRSLRIRYTNRAAEYRVPAKERLYCPHPDCGVFVGQRHSSSFRRMKSGGSIIATTTSKTTSCCRGHPICIPCGQPGHPDDGPNCRRDPDRRLADELADEEAWRRCFKCDVLVEHADACHHMTCRCGAQFCFVCGRKWRTCDCTSDMLRLVKDAAKKRREERTRRERDDRRAAKKRAESDAVAAAQARILRRHAAREAARAAATEAEARLARVDAQLDRVCWQQRRKLQQLQAAREHALRDEAHGIHERLRAAHDADLAALDARADGDGDAGLRRELAARVRLERDAEAAYRALLQPLWAGRSDRNERIAAAMAAYMRHNDAAMLAWRAAREAEAARDRHRRGKDRDIKLELHARELARVDEAFAAREAELLARHRAERCWAKALLEERRSVFRQLKRREMERVSQVADEAS